MKLLKKIDRIVVKKCFVASQYIRKNNLEEKRYLPKLERDEFLKRLKQSKDFVAKIRENKLDKSISDESIRRLNIYNNLEWYEGYVFPDEVGVWKGAGGMPIAWTRGNLSETAAFAKKDLASGGEKLSARSKRAIPRMTEHLDLIEKERYLFPVVVPSEKEGRIGMKKLDWVFDDGNMRAVTLVISGRKKIKAFIGVPKK